VRSDFRFFWRFTQNRQEEAGAAHEFSVFAIALEHDPEKWIRFSEKIMLKQQAKAKWRLNLIRIPL
jgi:hypothetical protein